MNEHPRAALYGILISFRYARNERSGNQIMDGFEGNFLAGLLGGIGLAPNSAKSVVVVVVGGLAVAALTGYFMFQPPG